MNAANNVGPATAKPTPLGVEPENIPAELKALKKRWVVWRYVWKGNRWTKPPFQANGVKAMPNDPETWTDYEIVLAAYNTGKFDGIGLMLQEPYMGYDLDGCIDPATGVIHPLAQKILDTVPTYAEISPSGTGLRFFGRGKLPDGSRNKLEGVFGEGNHTGFEQYQDGRYLTITGHTAQGHTEIMDCTEVAVEVSRMMRLDGKKKKKGNGVAMGEQPRVVAGTDMDDATLLDRALKQPAFAALWSGDLSGHGGDPSAADLALCNMLARRTNRDPIRMDRLFRQSGLMRPKWDERHGALKYFEMTIAKALEEFNPGQEAEINEDLTTLEGRLDEAAASEQAALAQADETYGKAEADAQEARKAALLGADNEGKAAAKQDYDKAVAAAKAACEEAKAEAKQSREKARQAVKEDAKALLKERNHELSILKRQEPVAFNEILARLATATGLKQSVIKAEIKAGNGERGLNDEQKQFLSGYVYLNKDNLFANIETAVTYSPVAFTMMAEQALPNAWHDPVNLVFAREQGQILNHDAYKPGQARIVEAESTVGIIEPLFNVYNAPKLPDPQYNAADEALFLDHLMYLTDNNAEFVGYLLNFMATLVQFPGKKMHSSPVIIGLKGNGKSFIADLMTAILGKSNTSVITTSELAGSFQDDFAFKQLCVVEEVKVQEKQIGLMETLKPWITNKRVALNRKNRAKITVDNVGNWMFFSNHDDALRIDNEERRYAVAISRAAPKTPDYYTKLFSTFIPVDGGSVASVLFMLKNRDLSAFNRHAPAIFTEARAEMIQNTLSALDRSLIDAIEAAQNGSLAGSIGCSLSAEIITADDWASVVEQTEHETSGSLSTLKTLSLRYIGKAAKDAGLINLGQKRLFGEKKTSIYAIRNGDHWRNRSESAMKDYLIAHVKAFNAKNPGKNAIGVHSLPPVGAVPNQPPAGGSLH